MKLRGKLSNPVAFGLTDINGELVRGAEIELLPPDFSKLKIGDKLLCEIEVEQNDIWGIQKGIQMIASIQRYHIVAILPKQEWCECGAKPLKLKTRELDWCLHCQLPLKPKQPTQYEIDRGNAMDKAVFKTGLPEGCKMDSGDIDFGTEIFNKFNQLIQYLRERE